MKTISIITPVLNAENYIESNILSVNKLNIPYEHIIVDGGSTDNTLKIISAYKEIKLLKQNNKFGMYGAIHQGILSSSGKYLTYLNADDKIFINGFEKMFNYILQNHVDVVYSDAILQADKHNIQFSKANIFGKFFLRNGIMPFIQPSSIFSKKSYELVGGLNYKNFRIIGDLDLFYRLAKNDNIIFKYTRGISSVFLVREDSFGNINSKKVKTEKMENNIPIPSLAIRFLFKITNYLY